MRVIREGNLIIGRMEVKCPKCEAVLEIKAKDLRETGFLNAYQYTCPCCLRSHTILKSELIEDVRFDLDHPKK